MKTFVRICPWTDYDLAIGDLVVWSGHDHEGLWGISSMHYVLSDGRKAASIVLDADFKSNRRHRREEIVPLDDLKCVVDACSANATAQGREAYPAAGGSAEGRP